MGVSTLVEAGRHGPREGEGESRGESDGEEAQYEEGAAQEETPGQ